MLNIEPIKLLSGSHADTSKTGSGCFMNVIAYLNGESQITDQSPCVCVTMRRIAIWLNDYMNDSERHALLPFVQRAMGTATDDDAVIRTRLEEVVRFANDMALYAKRYAAAATAAANAATNAAAAADAADADAADAANRKEVITRGLAFMEAVCPPADLPSQVLIDRANKLIELASA